MNKYSEKMWGEFLGPWIGALFCGAGIWIGEAAPGSVSTEGNHVRIALSIPFIWCMYTMIKAFQKEILFSIIALLELGALIYIHIYMKQHFLEHWNPLVAIPYIYLVKKTYDAFHKENRNKYRTSNQSSEPT